MWNILIVDDDYVARKLLFEILKTKAFCDMAANGREALFAYERSIEEKKPYDMILLDIEMPDLNGKDVLEQIRQKETAAQIQLGRGIPVLIITAHKHNFMASFDRGCDDFIIKPFTAHELIEKISKKLQ